MPSVTYECEDCGHQEHRPMRISRSGENGDDLEYEVIGGEVESCVKCGSKSITDYEEGVPHRDNDREDFHSDG